MSPVDLLVAGGGPTGLAVAIHAAMRGLRVVVVDPQEGVIDKACGEGLMPAGVAALERLGARPVRSRPFVGIRYVGQGATAEASFHNGEGLGIRRTVLYAALLDRCAELGIERVSGRVGDVEQHADHVEVDVNGTRFKGRYVVAADGLRSGIRRRLGLSLPPRQPVRLGLRQHFAIAPWSRHVEVHWRADVACEAYVTPVADDLVGIAMLFGKDWSRPAGQTPFGALLEGFPELRDRLEGAAAASHPRGAGPFEQRVRRRVHGRVLLAGDAAGYLDPLTGEGLKLGFLGAEALVDALESGRPELWESRWRRITRAYRWGTLGLLKVTRMKPLRKRLVPVLSRAPWLMSLSLRVLA